MKKDRLKAIKKVGVSGIGNIFQKLYLVTDKQLDKAVENMLDYVEKMVREEFEKKHEKNIEEDNNKYLLLKNNYEDLEKRYNNLVIKRDIEEGKVKIMMEYAREEKETSLVDEYTGEILS